jgi:hypothetical protein
MRWMPCTGQFQPLTSLTPDGRNRVWPQYRPHGEFCLAGSLARFLWRYCHVRPHSLLDIAERCDRQLWAFLPHLAALVAAGVLQR